MLLALETATNVCSVAYCDSNGNIYEQRTNQRGTHSEQLFLSIEQLQDEHSFEIKDLDAVLASQGPGSYTGLRISASAVKGLLFQSEIPLIGINTLASFAMQATRENSKVNRIHSIIDARRVHVYHQQFTFADGKLSTEDEVEVIPIKAFEKILRSGDAVIGSGLNRVDQQILNKANTFGPDSISAKSLIALYQAGFSDFYKEEDPELFDPKYYTSNQVN